MLWFLVMGGAGQWALWFPSDGRSWTVDVVVLNTWHETGNKYMGFCLSALASQKIHKSYELSNPVFDHQLYLL